MRIESFCMGVVAVILVFSCANNQEEHGEPDNRVVSIANPPSPLAQIMRDMDSRLEEIKLASEKSKHWPQLKYQFPLISDQEATEESMLTEEVFAYALAFKATTSEYNKHPSKEGFEAIVQGCLDCHYRSCPGPIVRIEKHMTLDEIY